MTSTYPVTLRTQSPLPSPSSLSTLRLALVNFLPTSCSSLSTSPNLSLNSSNLFRASLLVRSSTTSGDAKSIFSVSAISRARLLCWNCRSLSWAVRTSTREALGGRWFGSAGRAFVVSLDVCAVGAVGAVGEDDAGGVGGAVAFVVSFSGCGPLSLGIGRLRDMMDEAYSSGIGGGDGGGECWYVIDVFTVVQLKWLLGSSRSVTVFGSG